MYFIFFEEKLSIPRKPVCICHGGGRSLMLWCCMYVDAVECMLGLLRAFHTSDKTVCFICDNLFI